MNASSNDEVLPNSKEAIEVVEEFGCYSDCNWGARQLSIMISEDQEDRSPEGELMDNYRRFYNLCIQNC